MQYSLNEICLLPSSHPTDITSRKEVNPFDADGNLPIFVAPMTSILNADNIETFKQYKVIPIAPRNVCDLKAPNWTALSLQQFETAIVEETLSSCEKILIDIANGHMGKIYDLVTLAKSKYPTITIMVGNIAHPDMYLACCKAGVDYVRVGIGGGSVCSTSVQCGIHASHPWMIKEIKNLQSSLAFKQYLRDGIYKTQTKVIADGGINTIDKAIKCLALGYDYVMMGKCFAQCEEACGETKKGFETLSGTFVECAKSPSLPISTYRNYYGMASEQGQIDISGGAYKNPEGIETYVMVNTTLEEFTKKFEAALRSSMSYTGAHNLEEFKSSDWDVMSIEEFKSYYK